MKKQVKKKQKADSTLYCICRQTYEDERFMIQCNVCSDWFHGDCIGISEKQAVAIEEYHCPTCALQNGPLVLKKRHNSESFGAGNAKKDRHNNKQGNSRTGTLVFVQELKRRNFPSGEGAVIELSGHELTEPFLNRNGGLNQLILVEKKDGLGLIVPAPSFSVADLETHVGSMRELDVIDVDKQLGVKMLMREWTEYYLSSPRSKILNLISLEISNTTLADLVVAPEIVRKINMINQIWPKESPFNRPAVEKYCLMGIGDCFTDFHIDFGGSSVWYHVLKGEKVFYVIRPTTSNLTLYEQWLKSSVQGSTFFGDQVDKCHRVSVTAGQTLIIPSGWIHAVLTTTDTIAFGGNFLHFYNVGLQAQVYEIEKRTSTPGRFKFPSYVTCYWYAAEFLCKHLVSAREERRPPHQMLFRAAKEMALVLKAWVAVKDYLAKHADMIPAETVPAKLVKELTKQVAYVDKTALAENPVVPPQRPQRKNAGANMVIGRKGPSKKEKEELIEEVPKKAKKGKKSPVVEKVADPIRSPLFNISKPIPSSPTADPASVYDFDEEEDDERQLTLDMTPIRVGKSRFSAAIAAAAVSSPSKKSGGDNSPAKTQGKTLAEAVKGAKAKATTTTGSKRGRKKGAGVKWKIIVEKELEILSGEENLAPSPPKRKRARRGGGGEKQPPPENDEAGNDIVAKTVERVEGKGNEIVAGVEEQSGKKKKKKPKSGKKETENASSAQSDSIAEDARNEDGAATREVDNAESDERTTQKGKRKRLKERKIKTRRKVEETDDKIDGVVEERESHETTSEKTTTTTKNRVLVDLKTDENSLDDDKGESTSKKKKKEKKDKVEKKQKKKGRDLPSAADNEDNADHVDDEETLKAEDSAAADLQSSREVDVTINNRKDVGDGHLSRKKRHSSTTNAGKTRDGDEHDESHKIAATTSTTTAAVSTCKAATPSSSSAPIPTSASAPDAVDESEPTSKPAESQPPPSPRTDREPSSPTFASKLSSPPHGFSSPHPHHQPPTMLSPTGDHPPLKLKLSINKVFQAKLEGTASTTSVNSSDGEQSTTEGDSTLGSPPPSVKSPAWAGRRDPLGLSAPLPEKQGGIFGLASRSFSSPARAAAAAGLSPIRSNSHDASGDVTAPGRNGLLNSPRLLIGSPSTANEGLLRSPHAAGMLFPNFMSSTPNVKPQRAVRSTWATKDATEGDVIKAAHEDQDYIYPALEISDFDDGSSGAVSKDDTWNPASKCVPNCPKPERERRDGVKNEAVEKLQEEAKKRLEGQTISKRPNVQKKKVKETGTSLLSMPMHGTSEPSDSDDEIRGPGSSLRIDLESRPSTSVAQRPPTASLAKPPVNKVEKVKPKKGQATAKQRLGKILKLHRIVH